MASFSILDLLERTEDFGDSMKVLEIYINEPLYRKIVGLEKYEELETEGMRAVEEVGRIIQGYTDLSGVMSEVDLGKLRGIRQDFQKLETIRDQKERLLIRKKMYEESRNGKELYTTLMKITSDPCDDGRQELRDLERTYLSQGEIDERFERLWRLALRWIELGEEMDRRRKG